MKRGYAHLAEKTFVVDTVEAKPGDHVVEDAHRREGIRPLEHHPDPAAQHLRLNIRSVDVEVAKPDAASNGPSGVVVEPVDGTQHTRLATPGRTDEGGHLAGGHLEGDIADGDMIAEGDAHVVERHGGAVHFGIRSVCRRLRFLGEPPRPVVEMGPRIGCVVGRLACDLVVPLHRVFLLSVQATIRAVTLRISTRARSTNAVPHAVC